MIINIAKLPTLLSKGGRASASGGALALRRGRVQGFARGRLKERFRSSAGEVVIHQHLVVTPYSHDRKS
jgi:hypothetical protein